MLSIHVTPPEVSAGSNSGVWPANEAMQSSPDSGEEGICCSRRLVVASGHLLLPAKGALVRECAQRSQGRCQSHQTLPLPRRGDGGKSHNMPTASLCPTDESGSHCSGVSQVQ